jgi:cysteine desulfurase
MLSKLSRTLFRAKNVNQSNKVIGHSALGSVSFSSSSKNNSDGSSHTTTPIEKMATDKRYQATSSVPSHVLDSMHTDEAQSPGFSIKGEALEGRPLYLDFQSTTPVDPRVLDAMLPFMVGRYGNPHSKTHSYGWESESAVEDARGHIASLIGASPKEIIFTSGATESNNMALKGLAHFYGRKKKHIITTQTEHKCVLDSCRVLETEGFDVTYLTVNDKGLISMDELKDAIREDTLCVSVMGIHNEIGVIQPLAEIGQLCRKNKIFFHSDMAQMAGKVNVDVNELNIDLASLSSHKMYGPKGMGAIYVRRKPRVRLDPIISGGGQERGLRSGTLSPALCVGMGEAARICKEDMEFDTAWITYLSDKLKNGISNRIPDTVLNGDPEKRYMGNLNVSFAHVEGESMLMALKNIAVSSGSACTSASLEPSYVLRAIGTDDEMAHSSIRFGIGRFTTEEEIDLTLDLLEKHIGRLREMSPLWEMVQEGIDLKSIEWTQDSAHHH